MDYAKALAQVIGDTIYQENIEFGEPRPGHPEGKIKHHIDELLTNLEKLGPRLSPEERSKLLLLVHTHDTFKKDAQRGVPITDPSSHASIAAAFLRKYCTDEDLVSMVQWHDEPFALYRNFSTKGTVNQPRLEALFAKIRDWELFVAFNIIDNATEGKELAPLLWFLDIVNQRGINRFTKADV